MANPDPLTTARDQIFSAYGRIARLEADGGMCAVSVNKNIRDASGHLIGLIGEFTAPPSPQLLTLAADWLREQGCVTVQGPIVRHTWYPFRIVTDGFDNGAPFTGEPWNRPSLPSALKEHGFAPVAWYVTHLIHEPDRLIAGCSEDVQKAREGGYTTRALDPSRLEDDLRHIHAITLRAFSRPWNYFFHPISYDEFKLVLGDGVGGLVPELIRLAFGPNGDPAAFVYCVPEVNETAVTKTLAVVPEHRGSGIAGAITAEAQIAALDRGLTRMAHALMRVGGASSRISVRGGEAVFRRYEILERAL